MTVMQCKVYGGFVVLLLLAIYGLAGNADYSEAQRQQAEYCRMVSLWQHDKRPPMQRDGWPDFRHSYAAQCRPTKERAKQ